jgi:hypothetical protein
MMEQKAPDSGSKRNRSWTAEERTTHKEACMGKRKLTLGEKLDIVRLSESTDPAEKKNQVQLASMFEKSRSAISKILQPDSVSKLKDIAASGVCTGVKRFIQGEHPALERSIKQWVDVQLSNGAIDFSGKKGDGTSLDPEPPSPRTPPPFANRCFPSAARDSCKRLSTQPELVSSA